METVKNPKKEEAVTGGDNAAVTTTEKPAAEKSAFYKKSVKKKKNVAEKTAEPETAAVIPARQITAANAKKKINEKAVRYIEDSKDYYVEGDIENAETSIDRARA